MARRRQTIKASECSELPTGVKQSDLTQAKWDTNERIKFADLQAMGLESDSLTFYLTEGFGWVLLTLHISKARRAASTDRSYAITLDGKLCRVGKGPHVKKVLTVYLKSNNVERLSKLIELHKQGQGDAGVVRDRISSRRAEGQLRRQRGESSWRWDS